MEAEHGERTQRGYAIEREGNENREKLNALVMEIDRAVARRRTNEERCAELDARSAGAQAEIGSTEEQLVASAAGVGSEPRHSGVSQCRCRAGAGRVAATAAGSFRGCGDADGSRAPAGVAAQRDPAGGIGCVVGAKPHHAGGGAHCGAGSRGASPGGRDQDGESATRELRRTARPTWAWSSSRLRSGSPH